MATARSAVAGAGEPGLPEALTGPGEADRLVPDLGLRLGIPAGQQGRREPGPGHRHPVGGFRPALAGPVDDLDLPQIRVGPPRAPRAPPAAAPCPPPGAGPPGLL